MSSTLNYVKADPRLVFDYSTEISTSVCSKRTYHVTIIY